jgi:hypothetical protein
MKRERADHEEDLEYDYNVDDPDRRSNQNLHARHWPSPLFCANLSTFRSAIAAAILSRTGQSGAAPTGRFPVLTASHSLTLILFFHHGGQPPR